MNRRDLQPILLPTIDAQPVASPYTYGMSKKYWYQVATERRKALGITYEQIAAALGVSKSTVGHWFTGRNRPLFDTIREIAKVLDTTVAELTSEDPYFVTDDLERDILYCVRETPPEYRKQLANVVKAYKDSFNNIKNNTVKP
ncbi:helix-turn-helix transcriptional regulator [Rhodoferax sp. 4810]|uniref:Helix-turn-helix transcriptional regulator n=1 Tax=Thiospirillum jenense TaxID=1653858 RepID=A0A839H794_9GAMM|nr:helix-turn-helix transcriptional regulator [Thiospirillum jenense]MBB1074501.1 helix-turn-helix transcriptional regulator [Rhodoferax jenense]MBB1125515.1 helix-turn-helix transcriptional regulator [Thiospirillum jenense]